MNNNSGKNNTKNKQKRKAEKKKTMKIENTAGDRKYVTFCNLQQKQQPELLTE